MLAYADNRRRVVKPSVQHLPALGCGRGATDRIRRMSTHACPALIGTRATAAEVWAMEQSALAQSLGCTTPTGAPSRLPRPAMPNGGAQALSAAEWNSGTRARAGTSRCVAATKP